MGGFIFYIRDIVRHVFIYMLLFFFSNTILLAQQTSPNSNSLDNLYTPKGNNPLSKDFMKDKNLSDNGHANNDFPKYTVKFNVSLIPRGAAVLNFEYNIKEVFSLIAIGGINFGKDYIYASIGSPLFDEDNNGGQLTNQSTLYQKSDFTGTTPCLGAGVKFLFDFNTDEWSKYLQIDYVSFNNNLMFNPSVLGYNNFSPIPVSFKFNIATIKYGACYVTSLKKVKMIHELYTVLGTRFIKYTPVYLNVDPITNAQLIYSGNSKSVFSFYFGLGYIIGLGFK